MENFNYKPAFKFLEKQSGNVLYPATVMPSWYAEVPEFSPNVALALRWSLTYDCNRSCQTCPVIKQAITWPNFMTFFFCSSHKANAMVVKQNAKVVKPMCLLWGLFAENQKHFALTWPRDATNGHRCSPVAKRPTRGQGIAGRPCGHQNHIVKYLWGVPL